MEATRVRASVRHREGTPVIDLPSQIDSTAEQTLAEAYTEATRDGHGPVLLNFTDVDYLSSTGIALIVGLLARARKDGRTLSACGLSDHYREIFEITRLADFMRIYPDESAAVAAQ